MKKLKMSYSYDDVTLVPAYSELKSRSDANPEMYGYSLPIIASCMDTLGKEVMNECVKNKLPFICHRSFKSAKEQFDYFMGDPATYYHNYDRCIWFAVGSVQKYQDWIEYLYERGVRRFCVDMAHGDSKACVDTIKFIKNYDIEKKEEAVTNGHYETSLGGADIPVHVIAGNVATAEGFKRLQKAGADGIRVGIASGSICSTNIETGMGLPILTSIMECVKVKNKNTWLIADGGIRSAGDIAKAIYFGADFCMIGKLLAATDLACGIAYNKDMQEINAENIIYPEEYKTIVAERISLVENDTIMYKGYHGMASRSARNNILSYAGVEGAEGLLKYTGKTEQFLLDTKLRLQSSLSYGGAKNWLEFRKKVTAYLRTPGANNAAGIHLDVITKLH